jgi:hypothetical protein
MYVNRDITKIQIIRASAGIVLRVIIAMLRRELSPLKSVPFTVIARKILLRPFYAKMVVMVTPLN